MPNEFDDLMPNSQKKNGGIYRIGSKKNPWSIIHGSSGIFEKLEINGTVVAGIISYEEAQFLGDLDGSNTVYLINHELGSKYVDVVVFDDNGNKVIPNNILMADNNNLSLEFVEPQIGKILVSKGRST